jgi:hypothetical protein
VRRRLLPKMSWGSLLAFAVCYVAGHGMLANHLAGLSRPRSWAQARAHLALPCRKMACLLAVSVCSAHLNRAQLACAAAGVCAFAARALCCATVPNSEFIHPTHGVSTYGQDPAEFGRRRELQRAVFQRSAVCALTLQLASCPLLPATSALLAAICIWTASIVNLFDFDCTLCGERSTHCPHTLARRRDSDARRWHQ